MRPSSRTSSTSRPFEEMLRLTWLLLAVVFAHANDDAPSFVETSETFAVSPVGAVNSMSSGMMLPPLKVAFWTTPNRDWTAEMEARLQGLVARFSQAQWIIFHPHQAITDLDGACKVDGDLAQLTPDCQSQCVNAGRYCAFVFEEDDEHAGLTGADIVMESARRLCIWREYYEKGIFKLFDYLATLRETKCDRSLSDNCLNRVYELTDIDSHKIADCFQNNGAIGPQIDSTNNMLEEELGRSVHIPNISSPLVIPQLAMNGTPLYNLTDLSDWQVTAAVCNWFPVPKPAICDFCLLECPQGNDNRDPTRQCLWDLTCGDERTLQDWMQGTGPVFGQRTNTTSSSNSTTMPQPHKKTAAPTQSPTVPTDDAAPKPSQSPTVPTDDSEKPKVHHHVMTNMTDFIANMTNLTAPEEHNTTTYTYDVPLPPVNHHKGNNPTNDTTSQPTSGPTQAPKPTPALPPYMGPMTPQPPTNSHFANSNPPHSHSSSGGTLAHPVVKAANNTTDPKNAAEGLIVAVVVLAAMVVLVALYKRWSSRKEIYTTVVAADRAQGGLASTASHATDDDLHLHVEMGGTVMRRAKMGSNGYAPPASETLGTWS